MRRLALLVPLALLAGCGVLAAGQYPGPNAADAFVDYVHQFCAPEVAYADRQEILVELGEAVAPHLIVIDCVNNAP